MTCVVCAPPDRGTSSEGSEVNAPPGLKRSPRAEKSAPAETNSAVPASRHGREALGHFERSMTARRQIDAIGEERGACLLPPGVAFTARDKVALVLTSAMDETKPLRIVEGQNEARGRRGDPTRLPDRGVRPRAGGRRRVRSPVGTADLRPALREGVSGAGDYGARSADRNDACDRFQASCFAFDGEAQNAAIAGEKLRVNVAGTESRLTRVMVVFQPCPSAI